MSTWGGGKQGRDGSLTNEERCTCQQRFSSHQDGDPPKRSAAAREGARRRGRGQMGRACGGAPGRPVGGTRAGTRAGGAAGMGNDGGGVWDLDLAYTASERGDWPDRGGGGGGGACWELPLLGRGREDCRRGRHQRKRRPDAPCPSRSICFSHLAERTRATALCLSSESAPGHPARRCSPRHSPRTLHLPSTRFCLLGHTAFAADSTASRPG